MYTAYNEVRSIVQKIQEFIHIFFSAQDLQHFVNKTADDGQLITKTTTYTLGFQSCCSLASEQSIDTHVKQEKVEKDC